MPKKWVKTQSLNEIGTGMAKWVCEKEYLNKKVVGDVVVMHYPFKGYCIWGSVIQLDKGGYSAKDLKSMTQWRKKKETALKVASTMRGQLGKFV